MSIAVYIRSAGMSAQAFLCDAVRTPIGKYGGVLSQMRADDLAAVPLAALVQRNPQVDWEAVDDVYFGCANQAGEDNRNVARMALLLAALPDNVPGATINRLCGSGLDAISVAARAIKAGDAELCIAGGVESMSRAPFVMPKATTAFARENAVYDTTIGWRFVNKAFKAAYGVDSMPETAENVATEFKVSRADQDAFALRSQQRAALRSHRDASRKRSCPSPCLGKRARRPWSTRTKVRAQTRRSKNWRRCPRRSAPAEALRPETLRVLTMVPLPSSWRLPQRSKDTA